MEKNLTIAATLRGYGMKIVDRGIVAELSEIWFCLLKCEKSCDEQ